MIEVKNIRKSFGDKIVLDDVSAIMEPGKTNLIIGSSGSGKTVFMKCLVGLLRPESGKIFYEGKDILTMEAQDLKEIRMQIGMLFQGSALFDSMTVERNVRFPLDMFTKDSKKEKMKRVDEVLSRVNLEGS
ncbi:MAG TPA: ATP-binding cassette domain-containing protein, partial [Flavipsychrobacter sp.]|nr:ATP-binding cassette domain-containing protein [Flavipsychrobacter sp.]